MAKMHFFYSVMNAGKSMDLLRAANNYETRGDRVLLITHSADNRFGVGKISTRMNAALTRDAYATNKIVAADIVKNHPAITATFVDEAQFFDRASIFELSELADVYDIAVMAYGLKTDSNGNIWDGRSGTV